MTAAKGHIAEDKFAEYRVPIIKLTVYRDATKYNDKGEPEGDEMVIIKDIYVRHSYKKLILVCNYFDTNVPGLPMARCEDTAPLDEVFKGVDVDAFYSIIREIVDLSSKYEIDPMQFDFLPYKAKYLNELKKTIPRAKHIKYDANYIDFLLHHYELSEIWENTPYEEQDALYEELKHYMAALEIEQKEHTKQT